MQTLQFLAEAV